MKNILSPARYRLRCVEVCDAMEEQLELFPKRGSLPVMVVDEIKSLGESGWKVEATASKLGLSYNVVHKYYKRFGIRRRVYKYRKDK